MTPLERISSEMIRRRFMVIDAVAATRAPNGLALFPSPPAIPRRLGIPDLGFYRRYEPRISVC
jgi:hypothetical protein